MWLSGEGTADVTSRNFEAGRQFASKMDSLFSTNAISVFGQVNLKSSAGAQRG
jgi:hypothetical protein